MFVTFVILLALISINALARRATAKKTNIFPKTLFFLHDLTKSVSFLHHPVYKPMFWFSIPRLVPAFSARIFREISVCFRFAQPFHIRQKRSASYGWFHPNVPRFFLQLSRKRSTLPFVKNALLLEGTKTASSGSSAAVPSKSPPAAASR